jgi:hypothetical protein
MPADEPELRTLKVLYLHGYEEQVTGKDISPKASARRRCCVRWTAALHFMIT